MGGWGGDMGATITWQYKRALVHLKALDGASALCLEAILNSRSTNKKYKNDKYGTT